VTPLNSKTYLKDLRNTLAAFIAKYFDGNAHNFGGEAVTIPKVDVKFDRPQYGVHLAHPVISFSVAGSHNTKQKTTPDGWQNEEMISVQLLVITADARNVWDTNEDVQQCVATVFNGASAELGTSGLRLVHCGMNVVQMRGDPSQDFQVSVRLLTFRVFLAYPRADSGQ
jgi:hypothetical protein